MFKITINEQDLNNLIVFLKRTNLTGEESFEFVKLIQILQNAEKIEKTEEQ